MYFISRRVPLSLFRCVGPFFFLRSVVSGGGNRREISVYGRHRRALIFAFRMYFFFFDFSILKINWQFKEFKSIKLLKCHLNLFAYSEFFKFYYSFFHFFRLSRLFKLSRYFRPFKLSYSSIFLDFSVFRFFKLPTFFRVLREIKWNGKIDDLLLMKFFKINSLNDFNFLNYLHSLNILNS